MITVCLVTYNTPAPVLAACLDGLAAAAVRLAAPLDVVVVDNGSAAPPVLPAGPLPVRVLLRPDNAGFAVAMNAAVRAARSPYVLCLNPDTVPEPDALCALLDAARATATPALLSAWLVKQGRVQVDGLMHWWFSLGRLARRAGYRARLERAALTAGAGTVPVQKASGGALFATRSLLVGLGPFDEGFFLYGEDADLSLRARAAGVPVLAVPAATVRHTGGGSTDASSAFVERARVDAQLRLFARHRGRVSGLLARADLALVTLVGLLAAERTSSGSAAGRRARLSELRRWALAREAPRYGAPLVPSC